MLDYMMVGFGLSGSSLAHYLERNDKTFVVFDDNSQVASKVAGGLYNPVVLKRFTLAWEADPQLATAIPFYTALENRLGSKFLKQTAIHRKFNAVEEQNNWFSAMDKPGLGAFLNPDLVGEHQQIISKYQFGEVFHTGMVDTKALLTAYSKFLTEKNKLRNERFDYHTLEINNNFVQYKDVRAKQIVFCEGYGMKQNPFFNDLPLHGNKGEYIIVSSPQLKLKEIIKGSVFIIPLGNDLYKVGATYEREFENQLPSDSAKQEMVKKLESIIDCDYTIVDQVAGVRPTVPDRKPLIGQHPEHKNIYLCNGFGSRGVLIAPTVTKQLLDFIEEGTPLPKEIDIQRFLA